MQTYIGENIYIIAQEFLRILKKYYIDSSNYECDAGTIETLLKL